LVTRDLEVIQHALIVNNDDEDEEFTTYVSKGNRKKSNRVFTPIFGNVNFIIHQWFETG